VRNRWGRTVTAIFVWVAGGHILIGCHNDSTPSPTPVAQARPPAPAPSPPAPQPPLPTWHGHFNGQVTTDGPIYLADALLTEDGALRMLLQGPYESDGRVLRRVGDPVSAQVVATVTVTGVTASGGGLLLGHACPPNDQRTFCHLAAPVQLSFTTGTRTGRVLEGAFSVTLDAGERAWPLVLYYADRLYLEPATLESVEGSYVEQFSEIAPGEQMVATVDTNGRLFFQSAVSGCVGNGALASHLGGTYNVYDASLTIESCGAEHGHLNGVFEGLATLSDSQSSFYCSFYSDNCEGLLFWLSTRPGAPRPAAMALWALPP
jgi:hypothetical protein